MAIARTWRTNPWAAGMVMLVAAGLALSACGRRGSPEAPPYTKVISTDETGNVIEEDAPPADRPFVLDPLL